MSEPGGALASGPESRFVVDAIASILDGHGETGWDELVAGAEATSWAAILHRLDVAGRALALDAALAPAAAGTSAEHVAALARRAHVDPLPVGIPDVLGAWSRGDGVPVTVDLATGSVDTSAEESRAWAAGLVLAWLVDQSGFPPQVVA